jgi:hypothetical protein
MHRSRILPLLLVLVVPACVPVATHGPRVEPGAVLGSVLALGSQPTLQAEVKTGEGGVTPVLPPISVFARYGFEAPVRVAAAVSVPAGLPFSLTHPEVDVYAQLTPPEWKTAASAGTMVSRSYVTPYVQLGRYGDGVSVYTTQSVALFRGSGPVARVWMPAAALQMGRVHLFVQGGIGRETLTDDAGADSTRDVRFLMGGVAVSAPLGRGLRRF